MSNAAIRSGQVLGILALLAGTTLPVAAADSSAPRDPSAEYTGQVRPLLARYCLACHSEKQKRGDLDLEQFTTLDGVRRDLRPWQTVLEKLDEGDMPPRQKPQPTAEERQKLVAFVRGLLQEEARARAGDPGRVVVRRLSHAEYDNTIRDLTGIDLHPTRDFPGDGAAGEGFTNAGEALVMSPTLLTKYLNAAREVAEHAVLLPDGLRFSASTARRDWTDETVARLRQAYRQCHSGPEDGRLDFVPYLAATIKHREELTSGKTTLDAVAAQEKLNPRYLHVLWQTLTDQEASLPLDELRDRWRQASPRDTEALASRIRAWQALLWKFHKIGSYMNPVWQGPSNPALVETQTLRLKPKPAGGQSEVVLYLAARDLTGREATHVVWSRPRLEGGKEAPLPLKDLAPFGEQARRVEAAPSVLEVHVPAALFHDREFVIDATLDADSPQAAVQFEVATSRPDLARPLGAAAPCVAGADLRRDPKRLEAGLDAFRRCFPLYLYFGRIVPDDEVICLRLYFREDEPLNRLFLTDEQRQQLDRLWAELRYVSQEPLVEERNYATFLGFVSQDGKEAARVFVERTREPVRQRAAEFTRELEASTPKHLEALLDFATRAYRRPLQDADRADLMTLYQSLRQKEMSHEEAFHTVLARVLVSPAFLYRIEQPGAGQGPQPLSNWELASRLSYFLWATLPDQELRTAAAQGQLADPQGVALQTSRMLKDPRTRGLATEFAAQWLQVRDIRKNREKNEKLFPTFDDRLRADLFEESVLYFQDLFQKDRSVLEILDSDHTFLNDTLAQHYGIPNVTGAQWRQVDGVRQYGRGGVLGLGSVLTTQAGASRTSPVLRGNWLVETLLGEKIPKPPPDVPRLPDEETGGEELTVRQLVEKHAHVAQCAVCHQRIDPFGFSLEKYDAIGRLRERDLGGRPIDARVQLRDGTQFEGAEGLRRYLLTQRREDFLRQFCRKLLGYALGRSVSLSDQPLVEEMLAELKAHDYRFSAAVLPLVRSQQFRYHRERDAAGDEEPVAPAHESSGRLEEKPR